MTTATADARSTGGGVVLGGLLLGAVVAVTLGVYGSVHDPTGRSLITGLFTATINGMVWLATIAMGFALFQGASALRIYGKVGGDRPVAPWLGKAHRASGVTAFLITIPVAYHCLWALGFTSDQGLRILAHSLLGCLFYGALVTKIVFVRSRNTPGWGLPLIGGTLFVILTGIWLTSSFWFFTTVEFPGF
jgi:hypothetical protein